MSVIHKNNACIASLILNLIDKHLAVTYYCVIFISFVVILIYDK
jgi:hypothetical protein